MTCPRRLIGVADSDHAWWIDPGRTIDIAVAKARTPGEPLRLPEVAIPHTLSALAELKAQATAFVAALRDGARRGL